MDFEKDPGFSLGELKEVSLSDEKKVILNNWASIFMEISNYCKKTKTAIENLEFSGTLSILDKGQYFILLKMVGISESNEPEKITSFLFYSPDGEGSEGVLLEIGNIRADWKNGKAEIFYDDVIPLNEDEYSSPSQLEVSTALREAVYFQSNNDQNYNLPPRKQTDLLS